MKKPKGCLNHPARTVYARGLCSPCYQMLSLKMRDGEITDAKAVSSGLILPRRKGWPGSNNPRRIKPFQI